MSSSIVYNATLHKDGKTSEVPINEGGRIYEERWKVAHQWASSSSHPAPIPGGVLYVEGGGAQESPLWTCQGQDARIPVEVSNK